jgi:hypothetical protein
VDFTFLTKLQTLQIFLHTNCFYTDEMQMQEFPGRAIMQFPGGVCVKSGRFIIMQTRLGCGEREEWEKSASCINAYYVSQSSWPLLCTHITTALHSATFAFMIGFFYVYRGQHFWSFIIHIGGHHISAVHVLLRCTCINIFIMCRWICIPAGLMPAVGLCVLHNQVEYVRWNVRASNGSMRCREIVSP